MFNLITQGVGKILRKFIASGLLKHVLAVLMRTPQNTCFFYQIKLLNNSLYAGAKDRWQAKSEKKNQIKVPWILRTIPTWKQKQQQQQSVAKEHNSIYWLCICDSLQQKGTLRLAEWDTL